MKVQMHLLHIQSKAEMLFLHCARHCRKEKDTTCHHISMPVFILLHSPKAFGVSETGHEKGNVQEPEEEIQREHQVLPPNSKLVVWTLDADQFIKWIAMCTYLLFMSAACWTGNLCGWDVLLYSWLHYPEEMQAISDPVLCIWGPHWVFELWSMNSFSEVNFSWCSISNLSFII